MDEYGGVRIYRNHARVKPYGDKGNDWLELNLRRARNPEFRVSTNQIIGIVDIGRDENPDLIDQTNREGLIQNKAFEDLRQVILACLTVVEAYYWDIAKERRRKDQKPDSIIECVTKDAILTTSEDRLCGDQTEDEEQTPLLKRYHELVDKQMCESLSALEKEELDTIKMRLDEIDESNEMLQQAEAHMDARRRLFDEQLEKISGQLKALLEQF